MSEEQPGQVASLPRNPVAESGTSTYFDVFTRGTASLLALLYAVGFVILAVYDAQYGIAQFSPLRARIFFVGFVFSSLTTLSAAAQYYGIAHLPFLKPVSENSNAALEAYRHAVIDAAFVFPAFIMAFVFGLFLFVPVGEVHPRWHEVLNFIAMFIFLEGYREVGKSFAERPKRAALFALFASVLFLASLLFVSKHLFYLTLFFFSVGLTSCGLRHDKNRLRYALDFRKWLSIVSLLYLYVFVLFGAIQPKYGGAPEPVVLYLNTPLQWSETNVVGVSLIDESDEGFYVLASPQRKAFFVPRGIVSSVYFGTKDDLPKQSK